MEFRVCFFMKVVCMDVSFQIKPVLHDLELSSSRYKLKIEESSKPKPTGHITYTIVISDFGYENARTGCFFLHKTCIFMS